MTRSIGQAKLFLDEVTPAVLLSNIMSQEITQEEVARVDAIHRELDRAAAHGSRGLRINIEATGAKAPAQRAALERKFGPRPGIDDYNHEDDGR